ncbi:MAG TPA: mechanosensitive ion channel domain-containing protein [Edaphobacter sp.]|nr:mechanosensitive ion channel domain-containing protein [Edaphobacter sp.]
MKALKRLSIVVPALLLVAAFIGMFLTRGSMTNLPRNRRGPRTSIDSLVDQSPWQTIEALAPLAVSSEEKRLARQAERLADHEVDQAFAQALRQASLDTHSLTGDALKIQERVASLQAVVKDDQAKLSSATAAAKSASAATAAALNDDLDAAKAQLQLDTDQLTDASEELAHLSGDHRDEIQRELTAREAAMKKYDEQVESGGLSSMQTAKRYGTLAGRISAWFDQRTRMDSIEQAQSRADADAKTLTAAQADVQAKLNSANAANSQDTQARSRATRLAQMHTLAQIHSILDDRIQTQTQLSAVYGRWQDQVKRQRQIVIHLILQSVAAIAFLLLFSALTTLGVVKLINRLKVDRRTLHTLTTITSLTIQILTLLLVVLIIFGVPSQMPTILGLVTAGLTVVFQDFILAFFGWFVLMGKGGIRVGDWVEINGVGGEVVEVGLFRTTLLETGNWTDNGHPTGRRTNFMNGFAIRGQYFNFSTSGQWLWDEIQVNIPSGPHSYQMIDAIHDAVQQETEKGTKQAVAEWQRTTGSHDLSQFSAEPSVDMRPASSGVDLIVRYVTRASDRFNVRNRLYQVVIELMQKSEEAEAVSSEEKAH